MKSENRNIPELLFSKRETEELIGRAYKNAIHNLFDVNTVPYDPKIYNRTGFLPETNGRFIRAGEDYAKPWTRDASINCWNAASLLNPDVARNTLWSVCERQKNGKLIIQRDNQWWDSLIWVTGAWSHYRITGDAFFLANAYEAAAESLSTMEVERYNKEFCLFSGPATMADGISGYPEPPFDQGIGSCFVLDYPKAHNIMTLSTNCIYYNAYRCAAAMANQLGKPFVEMERWLDSSKKLYEAVNHRFWMEDKGLYGYFIHGSGKNKGVLDMSQEGMGLSYAILFGIADGEKSRQILQNAPRGKMGMVCVWPHFQRYGISTPGRHNAMLWPVVSGMWGNAASLGGRIDLFRSGVENLAQMANDSGDNFYEVYHPVTGEPDGGWQIDGGVEKRFKSCPYQTWSATAFLRMIFYGVFGMKFESDGLLFSPSLPCGWGRTEMKGLTYRDVTLDIILEGSGNRVDKVELDGNTVGTPFISCGMNGKHHIKINICESDKTR